MDTARIVETVAQALRASDATGLHGAEIDVVDTETIGVQLADGGRFFLTVETVD